MAASFLSLATILLHSTASLMILLAMPVSAAYYLNSEEWLWTEHSLIRDNYKFVMQRDCNLVLYDNNKAVWDSGTYGKGSVCSLRMQYDGNLVIYDNYFTPIWASNTNGQGSYDIYLILQADRNVVIYKKPHNAIWATNTKV